MKRKLLFELSQEGRRGYKFPASDVPSCEKLPQHLQRQTSPILPELSELDVVRHYSALASLSFGVDLGAYPLGSCTMKYNPKLHNYVAALEGFANIHPLQDEKSVQGALEVIYKTTESLSAITGMAWGTLQPLAGAHGEYVGLKIIRAYHTSRGEDHRNKVIVPISAHGTNPASASMVGYSIVEVATNAKGLVDIEALKELLDDDIAAIMLTNPNTLGLFEEDIAEIATLVHGCGALLYYDGANLNAVLGISRPGDMGFDVVHLNLHKTFATPHGGGGPGSGPVLVKEALRPYLPTPDVVLTEEGYCWDWDRELSIGKVSGFWGNFLVYLKAYAYILTMGREGLKEASIHALLNANYMLSRLRGHFNVPYQERCMHEFVISVHDFKELYGVSALDFAKALQDYGYHPPTVYFPLIVSEALMFEPTESESKETLDGLIEALIELGELAKTDGDRLKEAPLTRPIKRIDEARAAKNPILRWKPKE
ncbi:MAG: aminomethyl-transferring glycine dehydrogenase subunit GcvPB [Sphaerochaetaceae bacterium]|jgi:glycine dehydrogenase subunit 2|nr:aminomethyl-transferring glycine dehydrogenase subunit GcvPB [Sphaerochaetaceae bacterium]HHU88266.1 aminomethyl-transferring glycine dehydrogenase subunit GcvPB [Spirochaetales bacterium]